MAPWGTYLWNDPRTTKKSTVDLNYSVVLLYLANETLSEPLNNNTKRDKISRKKTVRPKSVSAQQNEKLTLYDTVCSICNILCLCVFKIC